MSSLKLREILDNSTKSGEVNKSKENDDPLFVIYDEDGNLIEDMTETSKKEDNKNISI